MNQQVPKEVMERIKEAAKEFCVKVELDPSIPVITLSSTTHSLPGLISYHEGAQFGYSLAAEELARCREGLEVLRQKFMKERDEKDLIIHGLQEGSELWKQEYDNCRSILQELVDLKIIKDTHGSGTKNYETRKPLAWEQAKKFIEQYQHY